MVERTTRSRSIPSLLQYVSGSSLRLHSTYHPCSSDKRARDWSFRRFLLRTQKRGRLNDQRQVTDTVIFRKRAHYEGTSGLKSSQVKLTSLRSVGASLVTNTTEFELRDLRLGGRTHSAQLGAAAYKTCPACPSESQGLSRASSTPFLHRSLVYRCYCYCYCYCSALCVLS